MDIALDFAIQCSPDHPWLTEHPEWFKRRPDGSIRYAENPPKKYQDIVNPDFYCADRIALWQALRDVILFWAGRGVRIFRVDNPHTKPFPFWEWMIREVQLREPGVIFLSEAFTRPKIMKALAKIGFTQSYTYFTWRTGKEELQAYLSELTGHPERDYFRPNFFVNTPDILPLHLQTGEQWMFKSRVALAATLSSSYGIYNGFELLEYEPIPGREEYLNSEKYEIEGPRLEQAGQHQVLYRPSQSHAAGKSRAAANQNLRFAQIDDDEIIGFVKETVDRRQCHCRGHRARRRPATPVLVSFRRYRDRPAPKTRKPVRQIENLVTGTRHTLEWGGVRLTIDPADDPALVFPLHRLRGQREHPSEYRRRTTDRRPVVQGRHHLSASCEGVRRQQQRRHRRLHGA